MNVFLELVKKDRMTLFCVCLFCFFILMGFIVSYFLPPYNYGHGKDFLSIPPFWMEKGSFQFILGTDDLGRDMLSRLAYGARLSLRIGISVVLLSLSVGTVLGLLAGYLGGRVDRMIMRFVDTLMSFPSILIAILIVTFLGPGLWNAIIAVNVTAWPAVIRVVRSVVLKEKEKDYVQAVRSFGAPQWRILLGILPNCMGPLVVQATLGFSEGILNVAALSFLGLGAEPPLPEWGVMIKDGRSYMESAWWLITLPGLCLFLLVLSVNVIGEKLRDVFDPKS